MKGIIADTGPLYAAYDPSDSYHDRATLEISRLNNEGFIVVIPYTVLLEAHSLILKRLGIKIGLRFIQEISSGAELFQIESTDYELAIKILERFSDQKITMFDATSAVISGRLNMPVWTYDFHFGVMGCNIWRG